MINAAATTRSRPIQRGTVLPESTGFEGLHRFDDDGFKVLLDRQLARKREASGRGIAVEV
jgi:hypothetical protein